MAELSAGAWRLYCFLCRCRNRTSGKICPSVRTTAEGIDVHPKNIFKLRNELVSAGWAHFDGDLATFVLGFGGSKNATADAANIEDSANGSKNATVKGVSSENATVGIDTLEDRPDSENGSKNATAATMVAKTLPNGSKNATAYKEEPEEGTRERRRALPPLGSEPFAPDFGTPGKEKPKQTQATPTAEPFDAFKQRFPDQANIHNEEVIGAAGITNLAVWEITLDAWKANRYSTRNIAGMIENYRNRVKRDQQQPANRQNRAPNESADWRDYAPKSQHKLPNKPRTSTSAFSMANYIAAKRERQLDTQPVTDADDNLEIPF